MKPVNFILTGVGGQGILFASDILCLVGMYVGYDVKKTDVHGMAQRGGSVISHVRLADRVFSPVVPRGSADFLLSFEKLEACRWSDYLNKDSVVVINDEQVTPLALASTIPYPDDDSIVAVLRTRAREVHLLSAGSLADELGNRRAANVILLGTLSHFMDIPADVWQQAIDERVPPQHRELNRLAFETGRAQVV
jgi:indolepyruvate ferredoxin oxidoreductase beta subunit